MMNEKRHTRCVLLSIPSAAILLAAVAWPGGAAAASRHAHPARHSHPARHAHHALRTPNPVVQHLQDVWQTTHEKTAGKAQAAGVRFIVGNDVWQPGEHYQSGSDWLALSCNAGACSFTPASLTVSRKTRQGGHDAQPTVGQLLNFRQTGTSSSRKAVAWFQLADAPAWLKPGTIPAYGKKMPAGKEDTREIEVELPGGAHATLVPMLLTAALSAKLTHRYLPKQAHDTGSLHLQLRAGRSRQLLPGELASCSHRVKPGYLLWAGDMDGDGKADYLISYVDADGPVHLYLSGMASRKQLVGLGGVYNAPPAGANCDGELPSYLLR